jgi:hypothetical protein
LFLQFLTRDFAVTQNLRQETWPNCLTTMNRNYRATPIRVSEKMVAAIDANHLKSKLA